MRSNRCKNAIRFVLLMVTIILCYSGCASIQPTGTPAGSSELSASKQQSMPKIQTCPTVEVSPFIVPYYPPPNQMDLCGEPVPLQDQEVMERFDKEFTLVVYNHAQVYLWLKRMERYFPWLEQTLRQNSLPDDLKYVAVAESDLLPNACSPKGAAGPWQFMPSTGCYYGLDQKGAMDKRYDFEHASNSALRYLQDLHNRFKSWSLAIAAYNCGEGRVQEEIRSQKTGTYYQLKLPQETERYVFRILAIKAVLGNPAQYGFSLPQGQGYPQFEIDRTRVTLDTSMPIQAAATAAGTTYREIKRLNPALRSDTIPAGTHELKLPAGSAKSFEENLPSVSERSGSENATVSSPVEKAAVASSKPPKPRGKAPSVKHHTVQRGETLSSIARKYDVSTSDLKKANKLKSDTITPGQKLVIR